MHWPIFLLTGLSPYYARQPDVQVMIQPVVTVSHEGGTKMSSPSWNVQPTLCLFSCTTSITYTLHLQWYDSSNSIRARRTNDQPTISVDKTEFYRRLGREYSMSHRVPLDIYWYPLAVEELEDLCFDFGIEYDGDVSYLSLIW